MEQIGLLVLFALVWLVQLIVRVLRARRAPSPPPPAPMPPPSRRPPPLPDDEELLVRMRPRAPAPEPRPARPGPPARPVTSPLRQRTTLGTRRDLRRAIVLREVLGPCRAMASRGTAGVDVPGETR